VHFRAGIADRNVATRAPSLVIGHSGAGPRRLKYRSPVHLPHTARPNIPHWNLFEAAKSAATGYHALQDHLFANPIYGFADPNDPQNPNRENPSANGKGGGRGRGGPTPGLSTQTRYLAMCIRDRRSGGSCSRVRSLGGLKTPVSSLAARGHPLRRAHDSASDGVQWAWTFLPPGPGRIQFH
jgi:hypothetical protein